MEKVCVLLLLEKLQEVFALRIYKKYSGNNT